MRAASGSSNLTLGDVVEAVVDIAQSEPEAVSAVLYLLRTGKVRLLRAPTEG